MSQGVESNRLMLEMRPMQMKAMAKAEPVQTPAEVGVPSFSEMLSQAVDKVNETQQVSIAMTNVFEVDQSGVDLADMTVASQKVSVPFQAMTQVRNKLVRAYQDIMQMPV